MKIELENASKTIKKAEILKNVTLTMESGKIYGLQGPNGSGKTMLMRLIAGLIHPNTGTVRVDGVVLGKKIDFPPHMGIMLENPAFLDHETGLKNLMLLAQIQGTANEEQIRQTIRDVGLDPDDTRKFYKYSLGMKQRLGIAAAIMEQPELLLLDEPTNALDVDGTEQICQLIRRERDRGALVIVSSHDKEILSSLADEFYTVYEGIVKREGAN